MIPALHNEHKGELLTIPIRQKPRSHDNDGVGTNDGAVVGFGEGSVDGAVVGFGEGMSVGDTVGQVSLVGTA